MKNPTFNNEEAIKRYLQNRMSDKERNLFERQLQTDPFLAEALEGFEINTQGDLNREINELKKEIARNNKKNTYRYWTAAATVLLLVTAGFLYYQLTNEPPAPEIAVLNSENTRKNTPIAIDSMPENEELKVKNETPENNTIKKEIVNAPEIQVDDEPTIEPEIEPAQIQEEIQLQKDEIGEMELALTENDVSAVSESNDTVRVSHSLTRKPTHFMPANSSKSRKNQKIVLTEKAAFPVDSGDIFPDSFQTIPAETRGRVQAIQGVAIQDQVEIEGGPYLTDLAARPEPGMEKYMDYLNKNAVLPQHYPVNEKTVELTLSIDDFGKVASIAAQNTNDSLLIKKAKQLVQNGPKWNAKIINGQKVQSEIRLKIEFKKNNTNHE